MGDWPSLGNYGFYIGMSYGLALLLMIAEPVWLMLHRKQVMKNIMRLIRINVRNQ